MNGGTLGADMAWDSSRPVPWQRLVREWLVYAAIISVLFLVVFRDNPLGLIAGVLASGPLYLLIGAMLAKFGYQRKTLKEMRTPQAQPASKEPDTVSTESRQRPSPSRRTSAGHNNPRPRPKRKRRKP